MEAGNRGKPVPGVSRILSADKCSPRRQQGLPRRDVLSLALKRMASAPLFLFYGQVSSVQGILLLSARISVTSTDHKSKVKDETPCRPQGFR